MLPISPRQGGILITALLAVVAAVVGALILTQSGQASDVELTTANVVPAGVGGYVAFNTDLTSSQWIATFRLVERMGQKDPENQLKKDVSDEGSIDWEKDIAPFLGGNAAVFFDGISLDAPTARVGVVARCKDAGRALAVIVDKSGMTFTKKRYGGVDYVAGDGTFAAVAGSHLIVTSDEGLLQESLDVASGKSPSLATLDRFKVLRDELTRNFLGFVYVAPEKLLGDAVAGGSTLRKALESAGTSDLALQPLAAVISANVTGFQFQEATSGGAGTAAPMLQPHDSRFAKLVPGNAAFFLSSNGLADTWNQSIAKAGPQVDDAIRSSGQYRDLDDLLASAGREIGLKTVREIIDLLHGESAVAIWYPSRDQDNVEGVFLADVSDEATARDVIQRVTQSAPSAHARSEKIAGVDVTTVTGKGDDFAYAVSGGYLAIGTPGGIRAIIEKKGPVLADAAAYQRAVQQVPSRLGTFGYFDLSNLLRLTSGGVPPELDDAAGALEGLIVNLVVDRDVVRLNGALTVAK